jgi:LysR family transcriptional regulator for metE and metH
MRERAIGVPGSLTPGKVDYHCHNHLASAASTASTAARAAGVGTHLIFRRAREKVGVMLEVRHLRTIAALADTGSLARAAKRVHLSGSALSHQLKLIEDRYGELYLRKSQPLQLTAVGRRLLRLARVVDEAVSEAERDVALLQGGRSGDLRVAVECHSCFDWLMPAMDAFRARWEAVDLDLVSGFHPDPIGLLGERRADLVIVSRRDGRPGISYHPLFRFQMLALVPNDHAFVGKRHLTARDFASETLVTYPIPDDRLDVVREVLAPAGIDPPRRTTDLTVAILQLVASRRGVAVLPGWAVEPYLARGYVTARPIGPQGLWSDLHAATTARAARLDYMRAFIETMRRISFDRLQGLQPIPDT